jgi:hypothetical protein
MDAFRGKALIIYFSWQGSPGQDFFQSLQRGFKGLVSHLSWDTNAFRLRWDRIGKIIH